MGERLTTYRDVGGYPGIDLQGGSTGSKCVIGCKAEPEDKGFGLDKLGGVTGRVKEPKSIIMLLLGWLFHWR